VGPSSFPPGTASASADKVAPPSIYSDPVSFSAQRTRIPKPKVLVIGEAPTVRGVEVISWGNLLNARLSVADYNAVIINLIAIRDEKLRLAHAQAAQLPAPSDFANLLFSEHSEVVVVGPLSSSLGTLSPWWWLPVTFNWTAQSGSEVKNVDARFSYLLPERDRRWTHFFDGTSAVNEPAASSFASAVASGKTLQLRATSRPLALTRFDKPLGLDLSFLLVDGQGEPSSRVDRRFGCRTS